MNGNVERKKNDYIHVRSASREKQLMLFLCKKYNITQSNLIKLALDHLAIERGDMGCFLNWYYDDFLAGEIDE